MSRISFFAEINTTKEISLKRRSAINLAFFARVADGKHICFDFERVNISLREREGDVSRAIFAKHRVILAK